MTTTFRFKDGLSFIAESQDEAIALRIEEGLALELDEYIPQGSEKAAQENPSKHVVPDFEDLDKEFHVIYQNVETTESKHPHMLETYGMDEQKARLTHTNHIWTIVEGDDNLSYICPGYHHVNRLGYIQTIKSWNPKYQSDLCYLW